MDDPTADESVYEELGVPTVINAAGTKTRVGGTLIREEAVEAMARAAEAFVRISDLQDRASELIADATGAEAGYVTSGAAAGLELAAAACLAGSDPERMRQLPDTEGMADQVVMARTHRSGYDRALRAAGAEIVDVGTNDRRLGAGAADVEPWELAAAITDETAAVAAVTKDHVEPSVPALVEVAHEQEVPVIVDAAAELPPASNLSRFVEAGADLVVFSGGKAIRGPQSTGIVAGRADLVGSIAAQQLDTHAAASVWDPPELLAVEGFEGVPRQGIGRPLKVGKEELVGLLAALEAFLEEDHGALADEWRARADRVAAGLEPLAGLDPTVEGGGKTVAPVVGVEVDPEAAGLDAVALVRALREPAPRVFVGADDADDGRFSVNPICLTDDEADRVVERIRSVLGRTG